MSDRAATETCPTCEGSRHCPTCFGDGTIKKGTRPVTVARLYIGILDAQMMCDTELDGLWDGDVFNVVLPSQLSAHQAAAMVAAQIIKAADRCATNDAQRSEHGE